MLSKYTPLSSKNDVSHALGPRDVTKTSQLILFLRIDIDYYKPMKMILPLIPALIHIYIFVLESILWDKKRTNKIFGIRPEDVAVTKPLAFNQGFYNLFLAIAILLGVHLYSAEMTRSTGAVLIIYGLFSVFAAGAVLLISKPKLWRGALLQMLPALIAIIPFLD